MAVFIFQALTKMYLFVIHWVSLKMKDIISTHVVAVHDAMIVTEEPRKPLISLV